MENGKLQLETRKYSTFLSTDESVEIYLNLLILSLWSTDSL